MAMVLAGEMGRLVRGRDWAMTPLGPIADWSPRLTSIVDLLLDHPMPSILLWGPELIQVYNDGYARIAGEKHPAALGQPTRECWPEAWHVNAPNYRRVFARGESIILEDRLFPLDRYGEREAAYFTLTYSPVRDEDTLIAGIFLTVIETTAKVLAERERDRQEERLRLALAAARMGTWRWEVIADSHRRDANLNRLLGRPAAASAGPLADFLDAIHPDDRGRVADVFRESARDRHDLRVEFRTVAPDGAVRWLRDQGDAFGGPDGPYLAGACVDVTDQVEAEAALRRANDELERRVRERTEDLATTLASLEGEVARRRDLARRLVTAQEDERRRVSRDLHDSAGQLLIGLGLAFKSAESSDLPTATVARLVEAKRIVEALTKEIHDLAVRLRPTALDDIGLEPALRHMIGEWSIRSGIRADFRSSGLGAGRLPGEIEVAIYRVVQEALTNVSKHARASAVSVMVVRPNGVVTAAIEDDGTGFDPDAASGGQLGLAGMRERVALVGGEMVIESTPGFGTTVFLRFTINDDGDPA